MARIDLSDNSIHYSDTGVKADRPASAPPLLLIHGAGGSHLAWPPQLRRLAGRRVIAPDLPGHGDSEGLAFDSVAACAEWLLRFMDALGLDRVILAGHSMGGAIAQVIALEQPGRVAALALIATSARLRVAPELLAEALHNPGFVADFVEAHGYGASASADLRAMGRAQIMATSAQALLDDYRACDGFDLRDRVSAINVPTLVVMATADQMTPPRFGAALLESIPRAEGVTLEGCGHMILSERPDELAHVLSDWISRMELS